MASYETNEEKLIRDRMSAQWDEDTTPVHWPNDSFTPPKDAGEWVRFSVVTDVARLADVAPSAARHRFTGQVIIQVFTPEGTGSARNNTLCQTAIDVFNHYRSGGLVFGTAFKRTIGYDGSGYYQQNVLCPYHRDSTIDIT